MATNLTETINSIMENGTKQDLLDVFMKIYNDLQVKYKESISDLQQKYENAVATKQPKQSPIDKSWKTLGTKIKFLEIELIFVKTWVPMTEKFRGPCAYCEAFIKGKDQDHDYEWLREGIMLDLGLDRKSYLFRELPVDWNWRGATANDNPIYKKLLLREGMNLALVNGLDIQGFPSLRIWVQYNDGEKLEEVIDGFGVPPTKEEKDGLVKYIWNFNLRDVIYSVLEKLKSKKDIVERSAHRHQDDGSINDQVLFHQKPTIKKKN